MKMEPTRVWCLCTLDVAFVWLPELVWLVLWHSLRKAAIHGYWLVERMYFLTEWSIVL